jgi:hypothetical protein
LREKVEMKFRPGKLRHETPADMMTGRQQEIHTARDHERR